MLREISHAEYERSDPILRLVVHDHPRRFGSIRLQLASAPHVLCWRSDLIDPVIRPHPAVPAIWIGVDQRIACVSHEGTTLFSIGLNTSILDILFTENCVLGLCETEVLLVNPDYSIRQISGLREIPESATVEADKLVIRFLDGKSEEIPVE